MSQYLSKFPGALDTFLVHGSRDGIGLDIDWQKSDEPSSNEFDLITDAILEVERKIINFSDELANLTDAEIQQLQNINATTISAAQWGYLGALDSHPDQPVEETDATALLNLVNQSDIAWAEIDANTAGSGLVPIDATAVFLHITINSATASALLSLRKKGDADADQVTYVEAFVVNKYIHAYPLVGLDGSGVFEYMSSGCGVNDTTLQIRLQGWIEPA